MSRSSLVTIGPDRAPLRCLVCQSQQFTDREIELNTSGMEFLGVERANHSGTALIRDLCCFVHTFADNQFELWDPRRGYPR